MPNNLRRLRRYENAGNQGIDTLVHSDAGKYTGCQRIAKGIFLSSKAKAEPRLRFCCLKDE
ncbi:MAG: hypothetical protein H6R37_125 [Deltaproteobacteria bacterium]|jgi:hypothetical protein|nr:hypothetical protein [Deltaproteobacteria bacterium]